jgi:hypothetical protein
MVKLLLLIDGVISILLFFKNAFERDVTKVVFYKKRGSFFNYLLEKTIKSLISDLSFIHEQFGLEIESEEYNYSVRSIDLSAYHNYKDYKISILLSPKVKFTQKRCLDLKIEKCGHKIFTIRIVFYQSEDDVISAASDSRVSSVVIVDIIMFFDDVGFDCNNYIPIIKQKKDS